MQTRTILHLLIMIKMLIPFLLFTIACSAQQNEEFYDYKSAFVNPTNVKSIQIQCAFDNIRPTDGCDTIPDSIDLFTNLEYLSITETRVKTLPVSINKLKHLKSIYLGLNHGFDYAIELPKLIGLDSLESLYLWMTNFTLLPSCIPELKTLKKLGISFNHHLDLKAAFKTLSVLPNLKSLDISGIKHKSIPKNISTLKNVTSVNLSYLKGMNLKLCFSRLSKLKLESLTLERDGIFGLPKQIGLLQHLVYLNLGDNYISKLPEEFYQLKNLRTLIVYQSGLGENQIKELQIRLPDCKIINDPSAFKIAH